MRKNFFEGPTINFRFVLLPELYFRWVIDQSGSRTIMNQIQTLVTREKELRTKVCVKITCKSIVINHKYSFDSGHSAAQTTK